jgi:hypothetical protein
LPDNDSVAVDLKQAAVVIMSHLDRLAAPHAPPANFTKVSYFSSEDLKGSTVLYTLVSCVCFMVIRSSIKYKLTLLVKHKAYLNVAANT